MKLKIYTPGPRHFVTPEVAQAVGLPPSRFQADVYVAAHTKAEAFRFLTELDLAPSSVHDSEFRVATGPVVDALIAADALPTAGATAATRPHGMNSPAVWVSGDGHGCVQFGEFVRGQFVPDADLVAGGGLTADPITEAEIAAFDANEDVEMLLAQLSTVGPRIRNLEKEIERARTERDDLCRRAVDMGIIDRAVAEMGVTPGRVYQLRDRSMRRLADAGEYPIGLKVQVEDPGLPPEKFALGIVVRKPVGWSVPGGPEDSWVWVRYDLNQSIAACRKYRVRVATPSCSICAPEDAPYGLTAAAQAEHHAAKHGSRPPRERY